MNILGNTLYAQEARDCQVQIWSFTGLVLTIITLAIDSFVFANIEKLMKQNWVLRHTYEKSYRNLLNMFDLTMTNKVLVNTQGTIVFSNQRFIDLMDCGTLDKLPNKLKDFIHKDDYQKVISSVQRVIEKGAIETISLNIVPFKAPGVKHR